MGGPKNKDYSTLGFYIGVPLQDFGGFPKILGVPFLGVLRIRIIVFWVSILGSPYFGKLSLTVFSREYREYYPYIIMI